MQLSVLYELRLHHSPQEHFQREEEEEGGESESIQQCVFSTASFTIKLSCILFIYTEKQVKDLTSTWKAKMDNKKDNWFTEYTWF